MATWGMSEAPIRTSGAKARSSLSSCHGYEANAGNTQGRIGRERQRGPDPARLEGTLTIGVVGDLQLDHLLDVVVRALALLGTLADGRQQLVESP